ncbi:MAG: DUF4286 family protein [Bacteroidales bacterium]|nr:DUF4286 family protein [Candidatus Scybalocola fimicaballi]
MILLNTTYVVNTGLENQFLDFLRKEIVTDFRRDGFFSDLKLRVVYTDDEATINYCLQAECDDMDKLENWMMMNSKTMAMKLRQKFATSVLSFATVLEDVEI